MTTTEAVAIIGAIATPTVALAGYGFNVWRAKQDRQEARELAADARAHELRLAQGSRAYEDRKAAYRRVVAWAVRALRQTEETLPIISTVPTEEAVSPENPSPEEWETWLTEVRLFGTPAVAEALGYFADAVSAFGAQVWTFREMKKQGQAGSFEQVEGARQVVRATFITLTDTIRDELASL